MQTMSMLFDVLGYDYKKMQINQSIDVSQQNYEVLSFDIEKHVSVWTVVKTIIRKQQTFSYECQFDDMTLIVAPLHLFYARVENSEPHWVEACALIDVDHFDILDENGTWRHAIMTFKNDLTDVLDIETANNAYYTNGILSHNTIYGDPTFTPGGAAIPFHASIRMRLQGGAHVKATDGSVIGINVEAKIVKNKVARPFRRAKFSIIFGKGIVEHEQLFDALRESCEKGPLLTAERSYLISGTGGWKEFIVKDIKTDKILVQKKFTKSQFGDVISDAMTGPHVLDAIEKAFVIESSKVAASSEDEDASKPDNEFNVD